MSVTSLARFQRLAKPGDTSGDTVEVQFNPTEYTLTKAAQLSEIAIPGLDQPLIQFVRGQTETLTLDLFFDSTDKGGTGPLARSVTHDTNRFYELVKIESHAHAPPVLLFSWGGTSFPGRRSRHVFKCVVASIRQQFTYFNGVGVPLRAKLTVELREYKTLADQIRQLNLQSADHTKAHTVVEGETLSSIATSSYGDPSAWRRIAEANGIEDPLAVPAGAILRVPRGDA